MLTALAALTAVSAVVVAGRWYRTRVDAIGRLTPFPTLWVSVLIILAVLAATPGVLRARLEHRLSAVASAVAGRAVHVRCQALGGAFVDAGAELGYVQYRADGTPVDWTLLKRDQCNDLADYLASNKRAPSIKQLIAVHVLTHEGMHLAGITVEALAECAAMQQDAYTARLLGASAGDAHALAVQYYERVYPRMAEDYRSADCRPGGDLDENSEDAPWR